MRAWAIALGVGLAGVTGAAPAWSQEGSAGDVARPAGEVSLRLLRDKGLISPEEYKAAVAEVEQREAAAAPKLPGVDVNLGKGVTFTSPDKQSTANLRARFQTRATAVVPWSGRHGTMDVSVRRARLTLAGQLLSRKLQYNFTLGVGTADIEANNPVPLVDGFLAWTPLRDLGVQVGQFLVPMDRINLENSLGTQFVDMSPVITELWLQRDTGVTVFSRDLFGLGNKISYDVGIFGGQGRNRLAAAGFEVPELGPWLPGKARETWQDGVDEKFRSWPTPSPNLLLTGRVQFSPLGPADDANEGDFERRATPRLSVGVGAAFLQGATRAKGLLGNDLKLSRSFDYWMGALDFVFKWAGFSLLGEALARYAEHGYHTGKVGSADVTEYSRSASGLLLQGGYMIGPHVEVAARWAELIPFKDTDPTLKRVHEVAGVMNYYWVDLRTKLAADYTYTAGDELEKGNHQARVQLTYGF